MYFGNHHTAVIGLPEAWHAKLPGLPLRFLSV